MAAIRFAPRSSDVRADESPAEFGGAPRAIAPAGDTITKTTSIRFRFRYNACMGNEERAAEILRQAETSLRELVSAAVADGDYASVLRVAAWAKALSDLIKDIPATRQATRQPVVPPQTSTPGNQKQATPKPTYPRFLRQGDHLVRIAWSKKEKAEYIHKTPRAVMQATVEALAAAGRDGRIFSTKDFVPLHDSEGTEVPSYQVYVVIALLKQLAMIDQHGRQGYSIPKLTEFKDAVDAVWRKLPER